MSDKNNSGLEVVAWTNAHELDAVSAFRATRAIWPDGWKFAPIALVRLSDAEAALAAKQAPMSEIDIRNWWASENDLEDCNMCRMADFRAVVRAVEAKQAAITAQSCSTAPAEASAITSESDMQGCPVCVTCGAAPDAEALNAELVEALRGIADMDPEGVRGDDLGRASRLARAALLKAEGAKP